MKSRKKLFNKDVDVLLFEYLEGELPEEVNRQLEDTLAVDFELKEELDCWIEAHVEQDYYETTSLEERLHHLPISSNLTSRLYTYTATILIIFLSFIPSSFEKSRVKTTSITEVSKVIAEAPLVISNKELKSLPLARQNFQVSQPYRSINAILQREKEFEPLMAGEIKLLSPLQIVQDQNSLRGIDVIKTVSIQKPTQLPQSKQKAPKLSREVAKALRKSRETASQKERQMLYERGNIPYVIPLSSNF